MAASAARRNPPIPRRRRGAWPRALDEAGDLEDLPNVGPRIAADLSRLGYRHPHELRGADGLALYQRLCALTGQRQDPCVLDTFMAVADFANGAPPRAWWTYTAERKQRYPEI